MPCRATRDPLTQPPRPKPAAAVRRAAPVAVVLLAPPLTPIPATAEIGGEDRGGGSETTANEDGGRR